MANPGQDETSDAEAAAAAQEVEETQRAKATGMVVWPCFALRRAAQAVAITDIPFFGDDKWRKPPQYANVDFVEAAQCFEIAYRIARLWELRSGRIFLDLFSYMSDLDCFLCSTWMRYASFLCLDEIEW